MRQPNRTESSWSRFITPFVGDPLRRQQGRRNQRFSLEPLESRRLLSTITEYPASLVGGEITSEGGKLWFTESNGIGSFSPSSPNSVQVYSQGLPTSPPPVLQGITTGPDNNIWFAESNARAIGMLNTSNLAQPIQNFGSAQGLPSNARPFGITVGPDVQGNSVIWFTDVINNAIGMIDPSSHAITEFPVPASLAGFNGFNSEITTLGSKLYFTEVRYSSGAFNSAAIGIYTPATNTFVFLSFLCPS